MVTSARARFVRVSARKARLVLDQIRGKSVGDALATLTFTPRAAARLIEKVLRSAVANAEHNHQVRNLDDLRVVQAIADGGPSLKRVQPRAMGRAFFDQAPHEPSDDRGQRRGQRHPGGLTRRRHMQMRRLPAAASTPAPPAAAPAARTRARRTSSAAPRGTSRTKPREKK